MHNIMRKVVKNSKGITLIEIIIVLAIIAIVGAIIVPNLLGIADRARLRSDIQSTIVLRNALNLYMVESGSATVSNDISHVLTRLYSNGYLLYQISASDPQTYGAVWQILNNQILLIVPNNIFQREYSNLTLHERSVIRNSS